MMKNLNKKTLILTSIITLSPIILGISCYSEIPSKVAIHWGSNGEANGWTSKNIFVFGIPILMTLLQLVCLIGTVIKQKSEESLPKIVRIIIWLIPSLTVILYSITLVVALGHTVDIRKVVCLILGILFIIIGNYTPKISYNNRNMINLPFQPQNEHIFRVFTRMMGITFITEGILILISIFFPPTVSIIVICLLFGILIGLSFYGKSISK